jgi:hypothetical protein
MGWRDWLTPVRSGDPGAIGLADAREIDLIDMAHEYEVIEAQDGFVLVSDLPWKPRSNAIELAAPPIEVTSPPETGQLSITGGTATSYYGYGRGEYNADLMGRNMIAMADKMRRSDGTVRSSMRLAKTPVLSGRWFVNPYSTDELDLKTMRFIDWNLFQGMSISWPQVLAESLLMLDFGHYLFEKVVMEDVWHGEEVLRWQKFAPIHPLDVAKWAYDANGGPRGVHLYGDEGDPNHVFIPVDRLAIFTYDREAGNLEGISLLRSAYKHWFFKENLYKIDAIQKERHGIGIPIIKLPPGFSATDKRLAEQLGRNLRTNEKAHVVLPPYWDLMFAKLEGQPVNAMDSIEHHSKMIYGNVLGEFVLMSDSRGDSTIGMDMFNKASRYIAEIVRDVFNKYCIPQMVGWNWETEGFPELRVRRIGDTTDWRTMSFAIRNMIGAGVIRPDDDLEFHIREEMDLPIADPTTVRQIAAPQMPGGAGLPRQAPVDRNRQPNQPGGANAGQDQSGG